MQYQVFGLCIDSDTTLAGLRPSPGPDLTRPTLRIRNSGALLQADQLGWTLLRRVTVAGNAKPWLLYSDAASFLLEYEGLIQYFIAPDGGRVDYAVSHQIAQDSFQWNLVHLVLPFVLHLRGIPVYHAGAANTSSGSLLFFGHTGQGKSTLSASFGKAGYPIVTDDVLVLQESLGQFYTVPSLPWVRLGQQSFEAVFRDGTDAAVIEDGDGKMRVDVSTGLLPFATEPSPVQGIYLLNSGNPQQDSNLVSIEPIVPAKAVGILLGRDIMLPILAKEQVSQVLGFLTRLVSAIPVWQLTINHDLSRLPEVVSEVVRISSMSREFAAAPWRGSGK